MCTLRIAAGRSWEPIIVWCIFTAMTTDKQRMDVADRHVSEGEARIKTQRALTQKMQSAGQSTTIASRLLLALIQIHTHAVEHRDRLRARSPKKEMATDAGERQE